MTSPRKPKPHVLVAVGGILVLAVYLYTLSSYRIKFEVVEIHPEDDITEEQEENFLNSNRSEAEFMLQPKEDLPESAGAAPPPARPWERTLFIVKTGKAVYQERLPGFLAAWIQDVTHTLYVADASFTYRDVTVHNVLEGMNDEGVHGWNMDKYKNIPAAQLALSKFPDMDWYVFVDDDTYVFVDGLAELLARFDPQGLHYLGNISPVYPVCYNQSLFKVAPEFNHGGSGYILSKKALSTVQPFFPQCLSLWKDCCCGDMIFGNCLRIAGIFPNPHPLFRWRLFRSESPTRMPYPHDACSRIISTHHLMTYGEMLELRQLELSCREWDEPVSHAHLLKTVKHRMPFSANTTRQHFDYSVVTVRHTGSIPYMEAQQCKVLCEKDPRCNAWELLARKCHLKSEINFQWFTNVPNSFSGVIGNNYNCELYEHTSAEGS